MTLLRSFVSNDNKKILVETTQLLENVLEQSSKSSLMYKALKTKPQMRKKVYQVKVGREVKVKLQELSKEREEGQKRVEEFAAKFNRQDTRSLEAKNAEAAKKWFGEAP